MKKISRKLMPVFVSAMTAVVFLLLAFNMDVKAAESFSDVKNGAFYYDSENWAVENGITSGTGDGKFSPDSTCTRGQIALSFFVPLGMEIHQRRQVLPMLIREHITMMV